MNPDYSPYTRPTPPVYGLYRTMSAAPYLQVVELYANPLDAEHAAHAYFDLEDTPADARLHLIDMVSGRVLSTLEVKRTVEIVEVAR